MKKAVLIFFLIVLTFSVKAQRTCATTEVSQLNKSAEQLQLEKEGFEEWLIQKRAQFATQSALQGLDETTVYQIPVVVHVIHNGEAEGVGINITKEQIDAQITSLNLDYRHLNPDSINTPESFQPLMADIGLEFVLAKRGPNGLPTNGITRTNGNQAIWTFAENAELKSLSYWSSDDYFNIWVAPLGTSWLGWAEYPTSEIIDGVNEQAQDNPLTDGVVINTLAFGSELLYPQGNYLSSFDLGRTATHEVGHFFGLRHIWGDGGCSVDDYVTDTPQTDGSYANCPPEGTMSKSCAAEPSMYMNYMDYVDDDCMNLFSIGQKERMLIVVNNSPRRASLLTSLALEPPPPLDVAIIDMPSPEFGICDELVYPTVTIQNTGVSVIFEVVLSISLDQVEIDQQTFPVTLDLLQDTTLALTDFIVAQYGTLNFTVEVISANGLVDDNTDNNIFEKQVIYSEVVAAMHEDFTTWPESWAIRTEAPVSQWNFSQAPNMVIENTAAVLNYYQNSSTFLDHLISPVIDLSSYTNPYLLFDYAYGQIDSANDLLAVAISLDCGNTFQDTLFLKSGNELATTEIPVKFTPSGPIDWRTAKLDLSIYGPQSVQIDIIGKSDGGNDIYLDKIYLVEEDYLDISLKGLLNESATYSADLDTLGLIVENTGAVAVNSLTIEVKDAGGLLSSQEFINLNLVSGERRILYLDNQIPSGQHSLEIYHLLTDAVSGNNKLQIAANLLDSKEQIPVREKFNTNTWNESDIWSITSPIDNIVWQSWPETSDFLYYPAFSKGNIGLHDWLVLPMLDFSEANAATIQYKIAYASNDLNNEVLRIWVSLNKGESYDYLVESLTGLQMATSSSIAEWHPVIVDDWAEKYINLSEFAGEENVLIAFETIDGDGNNIYLDDIELFIADEPNMIDIEEGHMAIYPNPAAGFDSRISFNLGTKQNVSIRILDVQGNVITNQQLTNVLNQTYPLDLASYRNGIYIIQATGDSFSDIMRILVSN